MRENTLNRTLPSRQRIFCVSWPEHDGDRFRRYYVLPSAALAFADRLNLSGFVDVVVSVASTSWREVPR
jgi:hypothetical protein